jgi:mannose-6-phosphate isomerase
MQVIKKPWGFEEVIELNDRYMVKRLTMFAGHRCSLQFHTFKQETIYVLSGLLKISTGETKDSLSDRIFRLGESTTIPPGLIHRMEAIEEAVYLEASTPELTDVVRLVDDYQRTCE